MCEKPESYFLELLTPTYKAQCTRQYGNENKVKSLVVRIYVQPKMKYSIESTKRS